MLLYQKKVNWCVIMMEQAVCRFAVSSCRMHCMNHVTHQFQWLISHSSMILSDDLLNTDNGLLITSWYWPFPPQIILTWFSSILVIPNHLYTAADQCVLAPVGFPDKVCEYVLPTYTQNAMLTHSANCSVEDNRLMPFVLSVHWVTIQLLAVVEKFDFYFFYFLYSATYSAPLNVLV